MDPISKPSDETSTNVPGTNQLLIGLRDKFRSEVEGENEIGFQKARERLRHASESCEKVNAGRRESGVRKAAHRVEQYASIVNAFLNSYAGVVEIAKRSDQQFGGMATGICLVALSVPGRKRAREVKIQALLEVLTGWVGRAERLKEIVKERQTVKKCAENVCSQTSQLADAIHEYYHKGSAFRVWKTATDHPENKLNSATEAIKVAMGELLEESLVEMCCAVKEIERRAERIEKSMEILKETTETTREDDAKERERRLIAKCRNNLRVDEHFDVDQCVRTFASDLDGFFEPKGRPRKRVDKSRQLQQVSLGLLETLEEYNDWKTSRRSQLLFLVGSDNPHIPTDNRGECWISPASAYLFFDVKRCGYYAAFYYFSRSNRQYNPDYMITSERELWAHLTVQVLAWSEAFSNDTRYTIVGESKHLKSLERTEPASVLLEKTRELFQKTLRSWAETKSDKRGRPAYIIVDRPDECSRDLISHLGRLSQIHQSDIKIFATGYRWKCNAWSFDMLELEDCFSTAEIIQSVERK